MTTLIAGGEGASKRGRPNTATGFSPSRALADIWAQQRDRWILWLAPAAIAGAAAWLLAPVDPPMWLAPALSAGFVAVLLLLALWRGGDIDGWLARLRRGLAAIFALCLTVALGALAAEIRTVTAAQAPSARSTEPAGIDGWVIDVDRSDGGPRLRLLVRSIENVARPPRYVRVAVPEAGVLTPGRSAHCFGVLGPPSGPLAPGGYDFARRAYFERLGATGYSYGHCRPLDLPLPGFWFDRWRLQLGALRADLSAAIQDAAPGRGGAIATALITGDVSAIDKDTNDALRNSGLGHLLSVSGVHMGIVGGLVFAVLTGLLALISPLALRLPVKKIAAVGALIALAAYFVVSGASVPALRSLVMAFVAFGAILLDRPAISMRGLALATLLVVFVLPESVLEPGFQMSFAATVALVAMFEMIKPRGPSLPSPGLIIGALQGTTKAIGGVLLLSFVAGIATDPFAIYHFQRFSIYALPANLIAEPIISFLVAPSAVLAAALSPFGHGDAPLQFMASALELVAAIGQTFGDRGEAVQAVARPPDIAFDCCVFGLLWFCLWRGWLRWAAIAFFAGSVWLSVIAPQPLAAFDRDLRATFVRDGAHWTLVAGRGRSTYARDHLGAMIGIAPPALERLAPPQTCSANACVWTTPGRRRLVLVQTVDGFTQACARNAVIIARIAAPADFAARCHPLALIDQNDIARHGGGIVTETPRGLTIARATPEAVRRAWTPTVADEDAQQE
ncbi:MAG: ComEC/Rec2 family competence protein [Terricaulis sp.]